MAKRAKAIALPRRCRPTPECLLVGVRRRSTGLKLLWGAFSALFAELTTRLRRASFRIATCCQAQQFAHTKAPKSICGTESGRIKRGGRSKSPRSAERRPRASHARATANFDFWVT